MMIRIAIDTMGGDLGPDVIVSGALKYLYGNGSGDTELRFVGPKETLERILSDLGLGPQVLPLPEDILAE